MGTAPVTTDPTDELGYGDSIARGILRALQAAQPAGSNIIGKIAGGGIYATANFTPTVVSYTAGNIIAAAKQFSFKFSDGTAIPNGSVIRLLTSVIKIDASALISGEGAYTAHGYDVTPPSARANNATWARASGDLTAYRGALALGTPVAAGGTCYVKTQFSDQQDIRLLTDSLWLELINAGTFTGAAVDRQVSLYGFVV